MITHNQPVRHSGGAPIPGVATVWRVRPHGNTWHQVGIARVNSNGRMRWSWQTTRADAVQDAPYRFQLRYRNHHSNVVRVHVIFGE